MLTFKDARSSQSSLAKKYARPEEASRIKFYAFTNLEENVTEQVRKIKEHPLIPKSIRVSGFIYEVETGKLRNRRLRTGTLNCLDKIDLGAFNEPGTLIVDVDVDSILHPRNVITPCVPLSVPYHIGILSILRAAQIFSNLLPDPCPLP